MIDTHCHLTFPDFDPDRDAMLQRAGEAGVTGFLTVATDQADCQRCLALANSRSNIRVALGIHPNHTGGFTPSLVEELRRLALNDPHAVAFGETGLDFYRDSAPQTKQYESFLAHLALADELGKPFILHCRAAEAEMLELLEKHAKAARNMRGVWHCFASTRAFAARAADLGLYFGLGGVITYPKSHELRAAAALMPSERLLLETDCPFLPPQGWRGQRNEPAYLVKTSAVLAETRGTTPDEIRRLATANAQTLFGSFEGKQ